MTVVAQAGNGMEALVIAKEHQPDVILLDIEMPVMNGLSALPELLKAAPKAAIIMCSTLTTQNAKVSLEALEMGATDVIAKPTSTSLHHSFTKELQQKILSLANRDQPAPISPQPINNTPLHAEAKHTITPMPPAFHMKALAIGASTGGPQALVKFFSQLDGKLANVPIFVTQHMPATFTAILADHIASVSSMACAEAKPAERITPGKIYIAPGDYHMEIKKKQAGAFIHLTQEEPENFCRPSVDPMLRSLASVYGSNLLTVIFTGMGHDGLDGSQIVIENGGRVIAQDKDSSIVWGMPGAVTKQGLCSAVLPLEKIAPYIIHLHKGGGHEH